MNYKSLVIIALALCLVACVPVSAMWNNGNWVSDDKNTKCDQIKFDPKTGVTSCYRDNNPVHEIKASENGNGGIAVGSIRAGYSTLSYTIEVRNVLQDKNESGMIIKVNPDATFRIPAEGDGVLAVGEYTATLDNFNLPDETVKFTIAANQQEPTRISFIGQAVSTIPPTVKSSTPAPTECPEVTSFGWIYMSDDWFWYRLNNDGSLTHSDIEYVVTYQKEVSCKKSFGGGGHNKCYETATTSGVIHNVLSIHGASYHIADGIHYSGNHKDEVLASVRVISCDENSCHGGHNN